MALQNLNNPTYWPNGHDTANENPIAKAEKVVVTGTGFSVTEKIEQLTSSLLTNISNLLRRLFGGATTSQVHTADTVELADGFSYPIDYRDNAQGLVNDATHYVGDNIAISGTTTNNKITFTGNTSHNRIIGLRLNIDNGARVGTGALLTLFEGANVHDFLHVDSDRKIQVRPVVTVDSNSALTDLGGDYVLPDSSDQWLIIEILPAPSGTGFRIVPVVVSVPSTGLPVVSELNDFDVDLTGINADALGISRVTSNIANIEQFKVITHTDYLSHNTLADLAQHHSEDRWCWGYAQLIEGTDVNRITLASDVQLAGDLIPTYNVVFQADSVSSEDMVASVVLPTDYADYTFLHISEYDSTNAQVRNAIINISILAHVDSNDSVRVQGVSVLTWVAGTNTLGLSDTADEIYSAILIR